MNNEIDIDSLRQDLEDDALGIMFNVSPAAVMELSEIENATDDEIIEIAIRNGYDLSRYQGRSR
jgi:phage major head subunit gpT-like protein